MNVSDILALARILTATDSRQVSDTNAITYANIVYSDLYGALAADGQETFFHTWYVNTIARTNTYGLPVAGGTTVGMLAPVGISVQYRSGEDYRKLRQARPSSLPGDLDTYAKYQDSTDPFFVLSDEYVMIFPEPSESVIAGLKIYGHRASGDLDIDTQESAIALPREYHALIAVGMKKYIFASLGRSDEEQKASQEYREARESMISHTVTERADAIESPLPDLRHFE